MANTSLAAKTVAAIEKLQRITDERIQAESRVLQLRERQAEAIRACRDLEVPGAVIQDITGLSSNRVSQIVRGVRT